MLFLIKQKNFMQNSTSINIVLNGKKIGAKNGQSVSQFLLEKGFKPERCVVEVNLEAKKYSEFKDLPLSEGDRLEVFSIVAGG